MAAIVRECRDQRLVAQVGVVICDRPAAAGITLARKLGIDTEVVTESADRQAFEQALADCLDRYRPDLIVLAGFMRVLSAAFVTRHAGRMLNIHPSLLPRYKGLNTHRRVLEAGDVTHGASVHFVTAPLDDGPIVLQSRVQVQPGDTEATLAARVHASEHIIYPRVIGWIADGRLSWNDGRPLLDGRPLDAPVVEDMSAAAKI